ncbi:TfoX/Sxy family protein [Flavobacterium capsici]|uniref:TfoX/Sxy family protein n=1 Tax=Flavobacterium capsici TaxID=3075618 RepID=A0AA96J7T5_9FLAO|nr:MULTISPECIES: TfoX/Sxy family protein [unclassified Flavobacterium]WNM18704.1 TfoX/Sxy family protein [Flavobacterium sp. PMR2A8]WNM22755.1 TfoX/Sxy family protein [Flavobacterium sp. PMTSA4]
MAYNEDTVQRIREYFQKKKVDFYEKKMFAGVCFMVDDKMCCGSHIDKKTNQDFLLCRIAPEDYVNALEQENVIPMDFTGKPMKGYIFVTEDGHKTTKELVYWLDLCLKFNPLAKSSKKR